MPGSGSEGRAALAALAARLGSPLPAASILAALSLCVVAADGPGWLAVLGWLAAAAAVVVDVARSAETDASGYGRLLPARLLLIAAAAIGATRHSPGQVASIWAGGFVVLVAVLVEPFVRRTLPRLEVANLPGFADAPYARMVRGLAPVAAGVLVLAGLFGVIAVPGLVRLILPLAALAGLTLAVVIGLGNARDHSARRSRLHAALERYGPRFAIYTGRDEGGTYQVEMWLPYLDLLAVPYIVITRRPAAVRALRRVTGVPVVARGSWRDLDDAMVPSLGAVFYVNSVANNSNVVGYRQMTHVYLGHGDSDKPLSHHPAHAMYDRVFVAGPAAIDRYAHNGVAMRPEAFVIVGRPQLAALRVAGPRPEVPRVLYAPTWVGYNQASTHSSLAVGVDIVRAILGHGAVVTFRPHPFSRTRPGERDRAAAIDDVLAEHRARTGRAHRWGPEVDRRSFVETANDSDAMVADVSSVVVDYLGADKPFAVVTMGEPDAATFTSRYPVAGGAYLVRPDLADLDPVLTEMLGVDGLERQREATRDYYLGGLDGAGATAAFLVAARAAIEGQRPATKGGGGSGRP